MQTKNILSPTFLEHLLQTDVAKETGFQQTPLLLSRLTFDHSSPMETTKLMMG